MKGIFDWLLKNKAGMGIVAGVVACFILAAGINGCLRLSDLVRVRVPAEVQRATNSPPKITLTEAEGVMENYIRAGEQFKDNISQSYEWLGFLTSLSSTGIELGKAAIPGGAVGLSLLSLAGGIFIKGPGTAKEKNASYNKGLEEGSRLASQVRTIVAPAPG